MKCRWIWLLLGVLLGHLTYSAPAEAQAKPSRPRPPIVQIRGLVRYASGQAGPQGVMVMLESERGGLVAQTQTDSQGKFEFPQLNQEVYVVRARHPGYREASQRADLSFSPTAYIVLELQPLPGEKGPPAVPPEGPGAAITLSGSLIPENAQKEYEQGNKLLMESKDPAGSISHFLRAIELYPSYAQAYLFLGTAYMDQNKWKDAQSALEKAIGLDNNLAGAHLALGACLNRQGNFAAAEKPLLHGLELNPAAAEGRYELGRVYWALGRWPEAEPHARKAVELRPDFAPAHALLGNIMLRKRDAPAALQEFKEYLRLDPNGPMAEPVREMVAKIEKALGTPR